MPQPGLWFDPFSGSFGFDPGTTPPNGSSGSGSCPTGTYDPGATSQYDVYIRRTATSKPCWFENFPGTFIGPNDVLAAHAGEPLTDILCNYEQCSTSLTGGQCWQMPDGSIVPASGDTIPAGATVVPCPPKPSKPADNQPGTSCDNPLWIKQCPPDKPKPGTGGTGGTGTGTGSGSTGGDFNIAAIGCQGFDDLIQQFGGQEPDEILKSSGIVDQNDNIAFLTGVTDKLEAIPIIGDALSIAVQSVLGFPVFILQAWMSVQQQISKLTGCDFGPLTFLATRKFFIVWASRILGLTARQPLKQIDNAENYICPVNPPSIAEANLARRTGDIDDTTWRCWVRMNNVDERFEQQVYNALRVQLTPEQIIMLWRRKQVADEDVSTLLSQAGMISTDDQMRLDQVTQFIPPVTDLLHFIVRGIGDPSIVERFGLLDEFDQLYQGKLKDWGAANGISDEVMESYHAGHWIVPPTGQLFTMLQRLRSDNVPPGIDATDWTVTYDDIDRALRENAIAPFWRERLKSISYNPIPMRQAVHAYVTGGATEDQVFDALQDNGYAPLTARKFIEWLAVQRRDHLRSNKIVGQYIAMGVNRTDANQRLQEEGYQDEEISDALDWASQQADDKSREKCLAGILRNYESGKLDETELQSRLANLGLDSDQVTRLADQAECQKKAIGKEIPAGQLCSMVDHGLITPAEYQDRLENLGYDSSDAIRIVTECNIKLTERQLAARERLLRQQAREAASAASKADSAARRHAIDLRRQANDLAKVQREQASADEKQKRRLQSAIEKAARQSTSAARMRASLGSKARSIEQRLARAAQLWAEFSDKSLDSAAADIRNGISQATALEGVSEDQAVRAAILAALGASKRMTVDLPQEILDIALLLRDYAEIANVASAEGTSRVPIAAQSNVDTGGQGSTNGASGNH